MAWKLDFPLNSLLNFKSGSYMLLFLNGCLRSVGTAPIEAVVIRGWHETRAVSTNWDKLKMPKSCWKSYLVRLDRSIHSLFCQKGKILTHCNFHFQNTDRARSKDVFAVNKRREGANAAPVSRNKSLWSLSWKTDEYHPIGGENAYGLESLPLSKFVE